MFKEINEHVINISEIKYVSAGSQYFKFMVGTKELEWPIEFRQEVVDAVNEYKAACKYTEQVGNVSVSYSGNTPEELIQIIESCRALDELAAQAQELGMDYDK